MTWCAGHPEFVIEPQGWGSQLWQRYDPAYGREVITPCAKLMVHHTASNAPAPGGEASFTRQIEAYGESRDGAAVEYHYLIYPTGVCHGGFGDTRGCHSSQPDPSAGKNYNSTAIGVSFVGYFHPPNNDEPTPAAIATFQALLHWLIESGRLQPAVLEQAASAGAPGWYGHRNVFATACPGDVLYPQLGAIIQLPPTATAPPPEEEMTDKDWERMEGLIHSTVVGIMRSEENAGIHRQYAYEGDVRAMNEQGVRDLMQIEAHEATLAVVRSPEFGAIIHTNTA